MSPAPRTTGRTATYALLGHPVARSRSPALHGALFAAAGIDAVYVCMDIDPTAAEDAIRAVRTLGLAGVNLTVPLKESVLPHLDGVTPTAAVAGAVNTLFWDGSRLMGDNTDGAGLLDAVHEAGGRWDAPAVVLGAGGSARAVAAALLADGCPRVKLLNRTQDRAEAVAVSPGCEAGGLTPETSATPRGRDSRGQLHRRWCQGWSRHCRCRPFAPTPSGWMPTTGCPIHPAVRNAKPGGLAS